MKQSIINRLSNPINRNRSAAKISKVMSSIGNSTNSCYLDVSIGPRQIPVRNMKENSGKSAITQQDRP